MAGSVWEIIQLDHYGSECKNCGQEVLPTLPYCKMCQTHMDVLVLPICRTFLNKTKNQITDLKSETPGAAKKLLDKGKLREIAIAKVIDSFPFELAARTSKFQKALETEGVWLAHTCCFLMVKNLRPLNTPAEDIVKDPLYKVMRETFYQFLSKGEKFLDNDTRETILNVYKIPKAPLDGSKVILNMIFELERQEKLQIYREKNKCAKCGADTEIGQIFCIECEDEELLKNRQAIASSMPAPILKPDPVPARPSGMHLKKDS